MIALIQRVTAASVTVDNERIAAIGPGLVAFVAVEQGDSAAESGRMAERLLRFRLFADEDGRMNLDLGQAGGELLLVSQFTLAADTDTGHRPSFSGSAPAEQARTLFDDLARRIRDLGQSLSTGRFGADMQVALVNDGPVTFLLRVPPFRF